MKLSPMFYSKNTSISSLSINNEIIDRYKRKIDSIDGENVWVKTAKQTWNSEIIKLELSRLFPNPHICLNYINFGLGGKFRTGRERIRGGSLTNVSLGKAFSSDKSVREHITSDTEILLALIDPIDSTLYVALYGREVSSESLNITLEKGKGIKVVMPPEKIMSSENTLRHSLTAPSFLSKEAEDFFNAHLIIQQGMRRRLKNERKK